MQNFWSLKPRPDNPEREAKKIAIEDTIQYAQQQADDLIMDLRRRRERQLLRRALREEPNGG